MRAPTISAIKHHVEQDAFFVDAHRIDSKAATRTLVGGFYQEAMRILFQADEHQIDGRVDICPDLSVGKRAFLEVKSVGCGRQALIYENRLKNDRRLVRSGATLTYVFVIHNVPATTFTTREQLYEALARGIDRVLVIPFERIRRACSRLTPRIMNYRSARSGSHPSATPMPGYRLSWSTLERLARGCGTVVRQPSRLVFGHRIPPLEIHGATWRAFRPLSQAEQDMAAELLDDLARSRLEVALAPAPRARHAQHCIRQVLNRNPDWYRRLCGQVANWRRTPRRRRAHDTGIKRDRVERSLLRLNRGRCLTSIDWLLRPIVERFAASAATTHGLN